MGYLTPNQYTPSPSPQKLNSKMFGDLSGIFWWTRSVGPLIDVAEESVHLFFLFPLRVNWGPSAPTTRQILYRKSKIVFKKSKCKGE